MTNQMFFSVYKVFELKEINLFKCTYRVFGTEKVITWGTKVLQTWKWIEWPSAQVSSQNLQRLPTTRKLHAIPTTLQTDTEPHYNRYCAMTYQTIYSGFICSLANDTTCIPHIIVDPIHLFTNQRPLCPTFLQIPLLFERHSTVLENLHWL